MSTAMCSARVSKKSTTRHKKKYKFFVFILRMLCICDCKMMAKNVKEGIGQADEGAEEGEKTSIEFSLHV